MPQNYSDGAMRAARIIHPGGEEDGVGSSAAIISRETRDEELAARVEALEKALRALYLLSSEEGIHTMAASVIERRFAREAARKLLERKL